MWVLGGEDVLTVDLERGSWKVWIKVTGQERGYAKSKGVEGIEGREKRGERGWEVNWGSQRQK